MPQTGRERPAVDRRLRRLYLEQALGWAVAWLIGIAILFAVAVTTHGRLSRQDLDAEMRLLAIAVYGLTWFEDDGSFHSDVLLREPELMDTPFDLWVIEPGTPATVHYHPEEPRFRIESLATHAAWIVATEEDLIEDGLSVGEAPYRLYGTASYDEQDLVKAAILVAADPAPWQAAHRKFIRETALGTLLLAVAGLLVGALLSRRALAPVLASVEQQKRFLAAAAHELRTPVASLRAVCESATPGDSATESMARISRLVHRTGGLVEELLLLARLDSATAAGPKEPVRLDLIAEAVLPEDGSVDLDAVESVVEAEPALLETALRNLVDNARIHGAAGGSAHIRVQVRPGQVTVEDDGPGFPDDVLQRAAEPFVARPGSPGTGLGLAIVQLIAERHGGRLILENRPATADQSGGARVTLRLGFS